MHNLSRSWLVALALGAPACSGGAIRAQAPQTTEPNVPPAIRDAGKAVIRTRAGMTKLADVVGAPTALAVHGAWVYWIQGSKLVRVPMTGGVVSLVAETPDPRWMLSDASGIYWFAAGKIVGFPDGAQQPVVLAEAGTGQPEMGATLDAQRVYYGESRDDSGHRKDAVVAVAKPGTKADQLSRQTFRPPVVRAVDDRAIYYSTSREVWTVPKAGGHPVVIGLANHVADFAVDADGALYIADSGTGRVVVRRKGEHDQRDLVRDVNRPVQMALDAENIWVTTEDAVIRIRKDGARRQSIGLDGAVRGIAIDTRVVYALTTTGVFGLDKSSFRDDKRGPPPSSASSSFSAPPPDRLGSWQPVDAPSIDEPTAVRFGCFGPSPTGAYRDRLTGWRLTTYWCLREIPEDSLLASPDDPLVKDVATVFGASGHALVEVMAAAVDVPPKRAMHSLATAIAEVVNKPPDDATAPDDNAVTPDVDPWRPWEPGDTAEDERLPPFLGPKNDAKAPRRLPGRCESPLAHTDDGWGEDSYYTDFDGDGLPDPVIAIPKTEMEYVLFVKRPGCVYSVGSITGLFSFHVTRHRTNGLRDLVGRIFHRSGPSHWRGDPTLIFRFDGRRYRETKPVPSPACEPGESTYQCNSRLSPFRRAAPAIQRSP